MNISKAHTITGLLSSCAIFLLLIFSASSGAYSQSATTSKPLSIAIIFDLSQSTDSAQRASSIKPKELRNLFTRLFQLNEQNQYFIISVSTEPAVILNGSKDEKTTLKALSKLEKARREGATALFDACYLGVEKVTQGEHSKRVLIVISDGGDTLSKRTLDEVKRALTVNKVEVYAVESGKTKIKFKNDNGAEVLDELASISGGIAFHPDRFGSFDTIVESIMAKLQE